MRLDSYTGLMLCLLVAAVAVAPLNSAISFPMEMMACSWDFNRCTGIANNYTEVHVYEKGPSGYQLVATFAPHCSQNSTTVSCGLRRNRLKEDGSRSIFYSSMLREVKVYRIEGNHTFTLLQIIPFDLVYNSVDSVNTDLPVVKADYLILANVSLM